MEYFTRQLTFVYILIVINILSFISHILFNLVEFPKNIIIVHIFVQWGVELLNLVALFYYQPWKMMAYIRKNIEKQ